MLDIENMTFEDDLQFIANKVSAALNIFSETKVTNNKLITVYGDEEFVALFATPHETKPDFCHLRLRTRDMAAEWDRVPVGFSQINESRGLLSDMKRAAHVSLKRNSIWYIDQQIKDVVGDRLVLTELTSKKGYLYRVEFTNGFVTYMSIVQDDKEYFKPHNEAKLYFIVKKNKDPISPPMTADECIMMLVNIAMQTDKRIAEFVSTAEQCGGKTLVSQPYRMQDDSLDEAKAVFANGYALKLRIENNKLVVEALGRYSKQTYLLDVRHFEDMRDVCGVVREFSQLPQYNPSSDN